MVLVTAGAGAVVVARHDLGPPAHHDAADRPSAPPVVAGTTVRLDDLDPTTTFLPLGTQPRRGARVSVQRAWNALVQDPSKLNPIPAAVHPYFGLLTDASATPVRDLPVWGFAVETGCVHAGAPSGATSGAPTSPRHTRCRAWEFVDARTGRDLGVTEQEVLPG